MAAGNLMSFRTFEMLYPVLGNFSEMDTPFYIRSTKITTSSGGTYLYEYCGRVTPPPPPNPTRDPSGRSVNSGCNTFSAICCLHFLLKHLKAWPLLSKTPPRSLNLFPIDAMLSLALGRPKVNINRNFQS